MASALVAADRCLRHGIVQRKGWSSALNTFRQMPLALIDHGRHALAAFELLLDRLGPKVVCLCSEVGGRELVAAHAGTSARASVAGKAAKSHCDRTHHVARDLLDQATSIIMRWSATDMLPAGSPYRNRGVHIIAMR